jgi:hypothetical protein
MWRHISLPLLALLMPVCGSTMLLGEEQRGQSDDAVSRRLTDYWKRLETGGVSRSDAAKFAGFFEGVTSARTPGWWEEQLWAKANGSVSAAGRVRPTLSATPIQRRDDGSMEFRISDFEEVDFRLWVPDVDIDTDVQAYAAGESVYVVVGHHSADLRVLKIAADGGTVKWTSRLRILSG